MTGDAETRALLRRALNDETAEFHEGQFEAIDALANRREHLLVVQRTGWGKSFVYFIAARLLRDRGRGPTLIVSPLLALMRNQIDAARRLRLTALSINSTNRDAWADIEGKLRADCQSALKFDPLSACKIDPPERHGGGCPGSQ